MTQLLNGIAFKLDVSPEDYTFLNTLKTHFGLPPQESVFHLTIGYIEYDYPLEEIEAEIAEIEKKIQEALDGLGGLPFGIGEISTTFGKHISLMPTAESVPALKEFNMEVAHIVEHTSHGKLKLGSKTQPQNFHPHMSFSSVRGEKRKQLLKFLRQEFKTLKKKNPKKLCLILDKLSVTFKN